MKYFLVLLFLSAAIAQNSLKTSGNLYVGGKALLGSNGGSSADTVQSNVGFEVDPKNLTGSFQIGLYVDPTIGLASTTGADALRLTVKTAANLGHVPYLDILHIQAPAFGAGSGAARVRMMEIDDCVAADTGCFSVVTHKGMVNLGDTLVANKIVEFGASVQFHGSIISTSRQLADTDHVLIGDNSSAINDTLPALSSSIGREYILVQKSASSGGDWKIFPHAGEKIETYDSIAMRSVSLGVCYMRLLNTSDKWRIVARHEEGIWTATLTGVTATVSDTGWYTLDNNTVFVRIKPLTGTSNTTALGITGLSTSFTQAGLDTTYTASATVLGYNNGVKVGALCVMPLSGSDISCSNVSSGFAAWTNSGIKGLAYGIEFHYFLPKQPVH